MSSHVCHPSLCDDNLSGIAVSMALARRLLDGPPPRHTVRFLYAPGTIGAITWLARNRDTAARIRHGLTLTCLGDDHPFTYKRTVGGDAIVDRAAAHVLAHDSADNQVIDFFPYGYDERQYNAPGFRLPVGSLMRGRHGRFPEYHTSGDDPSFVTGARMAHSLRVLSSIVGVVDEDRRLRNVEPFGEPQLGRRGLYGALGGQNLPDGQLAMLWVLNLSDGATRCWTSPSVPNCRSRPCGRRLRCSSSTACSSTRTPSPPAERPICFSAPASPPADRTDRGSRTGSHRPPACRRTSPRNLALQQREDSGTDSRARTERHRPRRRPALQSRPSVLCGVLTGAPRLGVTAHPVGPLPPSLGGRDRSLACAAGAPGPLPNDSNRGRDRPCGRPPRRSQRAGLPHWAPALGAGVEAHAWEGMQYVGRREPPGGEAVHPLPGEAGALAAAPQRLEPVSHRLVAKGPDGLAVAGHGVVGEVPAHHACQRSALFRDGLMPALPALVFDRCQLGPHPLRDGLALQPEAPVLRLPAVVREAEKVERLGLADASRLTVAGGVAARTRSAASCRDAAPTRTSRTGREDRRGTAAHRPDARTRRQSHQRSAR